MKFGENDDLGWSSIAVFVGTGSSDKKDVLDISAANEILMQAYITKDRKVSFRLTQPDMDDWKGYEIVFTGTGDSSTVYRTAIPTGKTFPDLKNIYGTRMSPEANESQEVTVKVFSYIARNRGHEPHASFKLNKSGGRLFLVNADTAIVDSVAYPEMPVGKTWSLGMLVDGVNGFGYGEPSPYDLSIQPVVKSRSPAVDTLTEIPPSGFYAAPFAIAFPESANVRCEKGGLAPTAESAIATVLTVESTTTIRCAAFATGMLPGEELVRTYVFDSAPTVPAGHVALWRPEIIVEERKVDDKTSKTVYELKYDELGRCTQYTEKTDNIARRTIVWEYNDERMTTKETNTQFNDGKWAYRTDIIYDAEGLEIFRESFRYDEPTWTKYESTARSVVIGPGGNPIVLMETTGFNYTGKEKSNEMRQVYEPETMTLRNQKRMNDSEEWRDTETFVFDELGRTVSSCSYDIYGKKRTESQTSYNADGTGISRNYTADGSLCDTIELDSKGREVKRTCQTSGQRFCVPDMTKTANC